MGSRKIYVLFIGLALVLGIFNWSQVVASSYRETYQIICKMVAQRIYKQDHNLVLWKAECLNQASMAGDISSKADLVAKISHQLSRLDVSHLDIYEPEKDKEIWLGVAKNTGIKVRSIDGQFVVSRVIQNSPAAKGGVLVGDLILAIDGKELVQSWQPEVIRGDYHLKRGTRTIMIFLEPTTIKIDESPNIVKINSELAALKISSFRGEYFERESWKLLAQQLQNYKKIIVDLRGNRGGDFVAMLRALSVFICDSKSVGQLTRNTPEVRQVSEFTDNSAQNYQLSVVDQSSAVLLKTYHNYPCYHGKVTVFVDGETASVAEVFAQSMKEQNQTQILGEATAGQVVMGIWYHLNRLGKGYSISIPEAYYTSTKGETIEGSGIWPEKILTYQLEIESQGQDSWIHYIAPPPKN